MRDWNIHLGLVSFWDDEALMQRSVYMNMEYDSTAELPVRIERFDSDGRTRENHLAIDVRRVSSPYGNIEICDAIYDFTQEQLDILESVVAIQDEEYEYISDNALVRNGVIHLGLVFHYSSENHEFVMCDLEIEKDPVALKIKEYDSTTRMATNYIVTTSVEWNAEFMEFHDEYQLYRICGESFLLSETQANYIDCV